MTTAALIRRRRRNRGGTGRGLAAPTITWDNDIGDLLPDFSITYNARINDTIIIRRTQTTDFSTYEEASDTVLSFDPPTDLEFDFGGDWPVGPWRVKVYYMRAGRMSDLSDTVHLILDTEGMYIDFMANDMSITDIDTPANDYAGAPGSKLTVSVSANGTYTNSSGVITQASSNTLRYDYDATTLLPRGLICENAATNLLLNSAINGTNLSTQSVSVSAVQYTLSFYGTGTLTLSGVSTAGPLIGTGAYPNRVTLTFTPTAGSLTLTRTGTVQFAQLETGSYASTFIPTAGSSVTRAVDAITLLSSAMPYNATEGTLLVYAQYLGNPSSGLIRIVQIDSGAESNRFLLGTQPSPQVARGIVTAASSSAIDATVTAGATFKAALAAKQNDFAIVADGGTVTTDTSGNMPGSISTVRIGSNATGTLGATRIKRVVYVPRRMTDAEMQAWTAA